MSDNPPADLEALALRCEQADGPSRELFEEAFALCNPEPPSDWKDWGPNNNPTDLQRAAFTTWLSWDKSRLKFGRFLDVEAWEQSALTLVPEGAIWEVGHKVHYPRPQQAPNRANYAFVNVGDPGAVESFDGKSTVTPALALCAAALRATLTQRETQP